MLSKIVFAMGLAAALSSGATGFYRGQETNFAHSALMRSKLRDQIREQDFASTLGSGNRIFCALPVFQPSANYSKLLDQQRSGQLQMEAILHPMAFEKQDPLPPSTYSKLADQMRMESREVHPAIVAQCSPRL